MGVEAFLGVKRQAKSKRSEARPSNHERFRLDLSYIALIYFKDGESGAFLGGAKAHGETWLDAGARQGFASHVHEGGAGNVRDPGPQRLGWIMSITAKSRKPSAAIDRPFAAGVLQKARHAAAQYGVIVWQEEERYLGTAIELPNCLGIGDTPDHCVNETREIMVSALATDIERGIEPPSPAPARRRTEQINIRVSPLERKRLEIAAETGGFHGISDYVRNLALKPSHRL